MKLWVYYACTTYPFTALRAVQESRLKHGQTHTPDYHLPLLLSGWRVELHQWQIVMRTFSSNKLKPTFEETNVICVSLVNPKQIGHRTQPTGFQKHSNQPGEPNGFHSAYMYVYTVFLVAWKTANRRHSKSSLTMLTRGKMRQGRCGVGGRN